MNNLKSSTNDSLQAAELARQLRLHHYINLSLVIMKSSMWRYSDCLATKYVLNILYLRAKESLDNLMNIMHAQ